MFSEDINYKNRYSILEILSLGVSFVFTKIFYRKAKLITYPVYMRGKKNLEYGSNLSIGYGCRFDLINPQRKTLFIGENCEVGDYCHFVATNRVEIGDGFLCASKVFISDTEHGCYSGEVCSSPNEPPKERKLYSKPVLIGKNVWIGDNVVVLAGSEIGDGCIIGANAVVNGVIEDRSIAVGTPARVIKRWNKENNKWERI